MPVTERRNSPCFSLTLIQSDSAYASGESLLQSRSVSKSVDILSPDVSTYFNGALRGYGEFSLPQKTPSPEPEIPEWVRNESRRRSLAFLDETRVQRKRANSAGEKLLHFFHLSGEARRTSLNAERKKRAAVDVWMQLDAAELLGGKRNGNDNGNGFRKRAATTGSAGKDVLNAILRFRSPSRERKKDSIPEISEVTNTSKVTLVPASKSEPLVRLCPEETQRQPASRPRTPTIWDQTLQDACAAPAPNTSSTSASKQDIWICHTPRPPPQYHNQRNEAGLGMTVPVPEGEKSDVYKHNDSDRPAKPTYYKLCDNVIIAGGEFFMPLTDTLKQSNMVAGVSKGGHRVSSEKKCEIIEQEVVMADIRVIGPDRVDFVDNPRPLIECLRIAALTVYSRFTTIAALYGIPADHGLRKFAQLVRLLLAGAQRQVNMTEKNTPLKLPIKESR
ncbi:uncharacterized protein LOC129594078 [Paramacrobiotus metropolitanus]|uniref:uncharacterized protein LOC129594078 n=1 Tax=Paramacrobiotus metropolitanus TaxID=2943436 RepID=UPI002445849C|nr:uncharacterized protein LOC129594078 [Paramacrobiotus metropolitanus]